MFTLRFALGLCVVSLAVAACSSTDNTVENTDSGVKPVCPVSVDLAVKSSTKCNAPGYLCTIGYPCGSFAQQAACTCGANGAFTCVSPNGTTIQADTTAPDVSNQYCVAQKGTPDKCPGSATMGGGKCTNAGQACYYAGQTCSGSSTPNTDVCTCEGVPVTDGGTGANLVWVCDVKGC